MEPFAVICFVICFALFGSFSRAQAYIDPATTSYVLELVVGLVVMGSAAFGYYWRKVKNKLKKNEAREDGVSIDEQLADIQVDDDED